MLNALGQRGSPDMPITPPTFAERLAAFGSPPAENVEDRRNEPKSGYVSMQAFNALVRDLVRSSYGQVFPGVPSPDLPRLEPKYRQRQAGQLREQAGYYDIVPPGQQIIRHLGDLGM